MLLLEAKAPPHGKHIRLGMGTPRGHQDTILVFLVCYLGDTPSTLRSSA